MGAETSKTATFSVASDGVDVVDHTSNHPGKHPVVSVRSHSVPNPEGSSDDIMDSVSITSDPHEKDRPPLKRRSTMVVVNQAQDNSAGVRDDPLMKKLEELHFFYPLMHDVEKRSGLFGTHNRKALADIQSKVQSLPALKIVRMYEDRLRRHAESVSIPQGELSSAVREADIMIASLFKSYSDRAKIAARHADRLSKLDDLKRNLSKCQKSFNECLAVVSLLNDMLPETERLEALTWEEEEASECIEKTLGVRT